jgi:GntR family transcriptional regulator/MocR family aminotransferase
MVGMRYQANLTIPIVVVRDAPLALHDQIADQVGAAVDRGLLAHGCQLPSTRTLATLLGVSRGVTTAAYDVLFARGYLQSQPGSGTYVAPTRRALAGAGTRVVTDSDVAALIDLRPGRPAPEAFPLAAWRAAWRRASFRRPPATGLPPLGWPELRRAVAEHLVRTRGIPVDHDSVVITAGVPHGLRVVLDALGVDGGRVAVEEPAPPWVHRLVAGPAGPPTALPVDADGARLDALPADCRAVVLRPDASAPLGRVLSARRRHDVATWAATTGGHVVELACDTVVRPGAGRLPRLSAIGPDTSVLIGGFCELLTPALKLGYAVVPRALAGPIGRRVQDRGEQPSYVAQLAVASLLADGTVGRLRHRLARLYAAKRDLVEAALADVPGVRLAGRDAVDTVVACLPDGTDAQALADALLDDGVLVPTLAAYHFSTRAAPPALVVGFAHLSDADLRRACVRLRRRLTAAPVARRGPLPAQSRPALALSAPTYGAEP